MLGLVLIIRLVREYLVLGLGGLNYIGNILMVVGWGIGYVLGELDHLFYAYACNPQELSCQRVRREIEKKDWKNAWGILKETAGERTRLPVHNVLTGLIVAVVGIWTITSSGSLLASGVVLGLGTRLLFTFWQEKDYAKWYWIFARQFTLREHNLIKWVWAALLLVSVIGLVR